MRKIFHEDRVSVHPYHHNPATRETHDKITSVPVFLISRGNPRVSGIAKGIRKLISTRFLLLPEFLAPTMVQHITQTLWILLIPQVPNNFQYLPGYT